MRFIILILFPFVVFGQNSNCTIHFSISDYRLVETVVLAQKQSTLDVNMMNNKGDVSFVLERPQLANLLIKYRNGYIPIRNVFPIYLSPGILTININVPKDSMGKISVEGVPISCDYQSKLEGPVFEYGLQIDELRDELAKRNKDSLDVKRKLNNLLRLSFSVPKEFIRQNSSSKLGIIALEMMGDGDPTVRNPVQELYSLFHCLDTDIQDSEDGKFYIQQLQLLQRNHLNTAL